MNVPLTPLSFSLCIVCCEVLGRRSSSRSWGHCDYCSNYSLCNYIRPGAGESRLSRRDGNYTLFCLLLQTAAIPSAVSNQEDHQSTLSPSSLSDHVNWVNLMWAGAVQMWSTHPPLPPTDILLGLPLLPPPAPRHVLLMVTRTKPTGGDVNSLIAQ